MLDSKRVKASISKDSLSFQIKNKVSFWIIGRLIITQFFAVFFLASLWSNDFEGYIVIIPILLSIIIFLISAFYLFQLFWSIGGKENVELLDRKLKYKMIVFSFLFFEKQVEMESIKEIDYAYESEKDSSFGTGLGLLVDNALLEIGLIGGLIRIVTGETTIYIGSNLSIHEASYIKNELVEFINLEG